MPVARLGQPPWRQRAGTTSGYEWPRRLQRPRQGRRCRAGRVPIASRDVAQGRTSLESNRSPVAVGRDRTAVAECSMTPRPVRAERLPIRAECSRGHRAGPRPRRLKTSSRSLRSPRRAERALHWPMILPKRPLGLVKQGQGTLPSRVPSRAPSNSDWQGRARGFA